MQDITGNRVDDTIDLNDSYSIHRPFGGSANCERIAYDQETKTASFLIRITEWGKHTINGDKLTFSVRNFLSDKQEYEGIPIQIDLGSIADAPETKEVSLSGYSGTNMNTSDDKQIADSFKLMTPSNVIGSPVKGIVDYQEYVFDVPMSKMTNYTLNGSFYTAGLYTEGAWQVTFPLVESGKI